MVELFGNLTRERKDSIRKAVDLFFTSYNGGKDLPIKLNELVNGYKDIDEQEFCDFYITLKFFKEREKK